jgi:dolichyl-phosphate-mannose--protein O-mannosyl transferase
MTEKMPDDAGGQANLPWSTYETVVICAMLAVALFAHFWRLQVPGLLVYDEHIYVEEAYKYLGKEAFFEVHPPLAVSLIAICAWLFGCHSWSWRVSSAIAGTALIPISYLLARRMFHSRRAAALSAVLMLCEGMFLEYSRLALINILYITLGAASYLALFRFMQVRDPIDRRRCLTWMGVLLGLGLGAKLLIPVVALMLAVGFIIWTLAAESFMGGSKPPNSPYLDFRYLIGALALVGSLSAFFFLLTFLPNYLIGWWSGVSSIAKYYEHVIQVNRSYPNPVNHQDSPWWTWPLLWRAYRYSQEQDDLGNFLAVWGGGNPAIWWAALVAIILAAIRAWRRDGIAWTFLVIGYLLYMAMWIPVHRALYVYSYMPAYYLGILALAGLLDACWSGTAAQWEQAAILLPVFAVSIFGLGYLYGAIASSLVLGGYAVLVLRGNWAGRYVCTVFLAASVIVFFYFLPLWIPSPLSESAIEARMWFNTVGIGNWM